MFFRLLLLLTLIASTSGTAWTDEAASQPSQEASEEKFDLKEFKDHQLCELQLPNGMRVIFKSIPADEDELEIRLIAQGGWTSFSKIEKANARIATDVLWESGFGHLTPDQLSSLMWRNSVELTNDIFPFSRTIEGSASEEGVETLFKMINWLFSDPQFTQSGMDLAKATLAETIKFQPYDANRIFDYFSKSLNTAHYKGFRQMSIDTLKNKTDLEGVREVYEQCFGDPGEFIAIITGSFDQETILAYVKKYFGSIPVKNRNQFLMTHKENGAPQFPSGVTRLEVPTLQMGPSESITRITIPLKAKISETNFKKLFLVSKLIDKRLESVFRGNAKRADTHCYVTYDFPFYPYIEETWITIQLRGREGSPEADPVALENTVIAAIKKLQEEGPTSEEISYLKRFLDNPHEQLIENEQMLQLFAINEKDVPWALDAIIGAVTASETIEGDELKKTVAEFIPVDHYTVISSQKDLFKFK